LCLDRYDAAYGTLSSAWILNSILQYDNPNVAYGGDGYAVRIRDNGKTATSQFDHYFNGNILWSADTTTHIRYTYNGGSTNYSTASAKSTLPTQWGSGNRTTFPGFVASSGDTLRTADTSYAIGNSVWVDTTTNSGSSSTSMTVGRAVGFVDGWSGVFTGDSIYVEGMTPEAYVKISSINYATKTLTLSASRSWASGAQIFYFVNGEKADDIGAVQKVGTAPPPATTPIFLRSFIK